MNFVEYKPQDSERVPKKLSRKKTKEQSSGVSRSTYSPVKAQLYEVKLPIKKPVFQFSLDEVSAHRLNEKYISIAKQLMLGDSTFTFKPYGETE